MGVRTVGGRHLIRSERGPWLRLLLLACCFLAGLLMGQVLAARVGSETAAELKTYLSGYFSLEQTPALSPETAASALAVYFRYPLIAFLLSFALVGAALLPLITVAYGLFLSFSVCCFTAAFGHAGVLLALAVFGMRCAITLPCYFAVAVPALEKSTALAILAFRRTGRPAPPTYDRGWWRRLAVVTAVLTCGVLADLFLSPLLLKQLATVIFPVT